jgi:hypothetical protein
MITSTETARRFAQSIASQAVDTQNAIDTNRWEDASNHLEDIANDCAKLQASINAKIDALNNEE